MTEYIKADTDKVNEILLLLHTIAEGPGEAYALLICTIWRLNFELSDRPASLDDLTTEITESLRSVSDIRTLS